MRRTPFWAQVLLGLVLGLVLGLIARAYDVAWLATTLDEVGSAFVGLLRLLVPPLVFTAVVASIVNLRGVANAARLAGRTLLWFAVTAAVSVTLGIVIGLVTDPGRSVTLSTEGATAPETTGSWTDFIGQLLPQNLVGAFGPDGSVLSVLALAIATGVAVLAVGPERTKPFTDLVDAVLAVVQKVLWWVIRLSPLGTLGLIGRSVAEYGWDLLGPLATFAVDVYVGCLVVLLVVYPLVLRFAAGLNPVKFFAGAWPALQLAFVSRSSVGTMPVTQRVTERLGVPKEYASFAVPLGATTKMDGCAAIYPALAAITVAQLFGVSLGLGDYLLIAFVSVVGSAATAGLTGAVVMLTLTLSTLGLPLAGVGLLLAIDPILDMVRTMTNVAGQALVPVVVAAREGVLDRSAYDSVRALEDVVLEAAPAAGVRAGDPVRA
ncbi:dicarboxylate/amino acid:cation symporter [Vallicoccus soli]|uniref:Dicarboxylate/amino acid:cation symporter n=1 Tax=Vallicoccus soli TaxID=2339232 RepID=A0A3A3ZLW2_9ACTN|nr:dicarboxylate/amino acid:cation symporter [Vallicoccus soli]